MRTMLDIPYAQNNFDNGNMPSAQDMLKEQSYQLIQDRKAQQQNHNKEQRKKTTTDQNAFQDIMREQGLFRSVNTIRDISGSQHQ